MKIYTTLLIAVVFVFSIAASHGVQISLNMHEVPFQGSSCTALSPSQIQDAYGFNSLYNTGINGNGQSVAIVVAYGDPTLFSDLATFDSQYGLPQVVNGSNLIVSYPFGDPLSNVGNWTSETALDVEVVHSLAPHATIYLVIAPNDSWLFNAVNYTIQNLPVQAISLSWGASEHEYSQSSIDQIDNVLAAAPEKHISVFAASGDSGAYNGLSFLNVNFPASSPYVIGVGGTSLSVTASGTYLSETAWNGSGGGYSTFFPKPAPQPNIGSYRMVPDVSFNAGTSICVYANSTWGGYFGTSVAAPSWAALSSLIDQKAGGSGVVSLNSLYGAYYSKGSTAYNLISRGNNNGYSANGSYNLVSGIGSPKAYSLAQVLTNTSYKIAFSASTAGAIFAINGINHTAPFSQNFSYNQKVSMSVYAPPPNNNVRYVFVSYAGYYNSTNTTAHFFVENSSSITAIFKAQFAVNEVGVNGSSNTTVFIDNDTYFMASSQLSYVSGNKSFSLVGIKVGENSTLYSSSAIFVVNSPKTVTFLWKVGGISKFIMQGAPVGSQAAISYINYVPLSNKTAVYTTLVKNGDSLSVVSGSLINYSGEIYYLEYRYLLQPASALSSANVYLNFIKESRYQLSFVTSDNSTVTPTTMYITSRSANGTFTNTTIWVPAGENFVIKAVEVDDSGFNTLEHSLVFSPYNYSGTIKLPVSDINVLVKLYLGIPVIGAKVKLSYSNFSAENTTNDLGSAFFNDVPDSGYNITIMAYGSNYTYTGISGKSPSFQVNPFIYQLYIMVAVIGLVVLVFSLWEELKLKKKRRQR